MVTRYTQLSPQLFAEISELWNLTGVGNPARGDNFEAVERTLEHGGVILMIRDHELPIGTAWLTHDYRRLYIHHMAVLPARQNQGIGGSLMQEAVKIASELGFQAKLEVHIDNPAANKLYSGFGFQPLTGYTSMIKRDI